jgi:hypothetical protein
MLGSFYFISQSMNSKKERHASSPLFCTQLVLPSSPDNRDSYFVLCLQSRVHMLNYTAQGESSSHIHIQLLGVQMRYGITLFQAIR